MKLQRAFRIRRGDVVAFIGAGGKTSALIALGHELREEGWRVLATTTTRIGADQLDLMPASLPADSPISSISAALQAHGFVFLHSLISAGKVHGAPLERISALLDTVDSDVLLIEADGSRGLPLKAHYPHEPVIPPETTLVIPVVSLSALGQPLRDDTVYNAQAIHERYGFGMDNRIKSPWIAQVLRDEDLTLRAIPPQARVIALINQVPAQGYLRGRARLIAQLALRQPVTNQRQRKKTSKNMIRLHGVALGAVRSTDPIHEVQRPVAAIVLAGGLSRRMGQSKVLMPWAGGRTIIEHIVQQLIQARVDHIAVITGHRSAEVAQKVAPYEVETVHNPDYATGEMLSSVKAGLESLPAHISAAMVVLGDQPRIQPRTVQQVMSAYALGDGDIVAPSYQMRRGHPILIDRKYWRELLALPVDGAPRDVINAHKDAIAYVVVDTDSVLRDVDTPEAYREERRRAGLD